MTFEELHERGRETFAALVPDGKERLDRIFRAGPGLAEVAVGTVFGHLHHRPALDPRTREVAALAAIVASGAWETPLAVHTRTALAAGLAPAEIVEVVLECAAFCGFPRAVTALGKIEPILAEAGGPVPPDPAPREVLLRLVEEVRTGGPPETSEPPATGERLTALRTLATGATVQVMTTGPDSAVAVFEVDGAATGIAHATVTAGVITRLNVWR